MPVAHAYVEAVQVNSATASQGTMGNRPSPWIGADDKGKFTLTLAPGQYRIRAKDEAGGYPDPSFWVNMDSESSFPVIQVDQQNITGLKVVLGKRGGFIQGRVEDAQTHVPIVGAAIRIQDARNKLAFVKVFTDSSGTFSYTVAAKPLVISVVAPGYQPTNVDDGTEITLSPGERRDVNVQLKHE